jgi:hypothetical protein
MGMKEINIFSFKENASLFWWFLVLILAILPEVFHGLP